MVNELLDIPKDIAKYLLTDEVVDEQFELSGHTVFTSISRIFVKNGNRVRDISYAHISSIELQAKPRWLVVSIGILWIVIFWIVWNYEGIHITAQGHSTSFSRIWGTPPGSFIEYLWSSIPGVLLVTIGYLLKKWSIRVSVAGMHKEQVFSGDKDTLHAFVRLLNKRRFPSSNTISGGKAA